MFAVFRSIQNPLFARATLRNCVPSACLETGVNTGCQPGFPSVTDRRVLCNPFLGPQATGASPDHNGTISRLTQ